MKYAEEVASVLGVLPRKSMQRRDIAEVHPAGVIVRPTRARDPDWLGLVMARRRNPNDDDRGSMLGPRSRSACSSSMIQGARGRALARVDRTDAHSTVRA